MNQLPPEIESWRGTGSTITVDGVDLWYRVGGAGPWLVCFHGFPTSSWDWHLLLPHLESERSVLVFDFPGYGLSQKKPGHDFSLLKQLDAALALMKKLGIESFDLLSHDMGNSVACELLYRRECGEDLPELRSLVMLNGGVYMDLHHPLPTQRLLRTPLIGAITGRLTSYRLFRHQYPKVYANPEQFDESHYRAQWALMQHGRGRKTLAGIACYMRERVRFGERWTGPAERLSLPFTLIWGPEDPIAVEAIALRLCERNPNAKLVRLPGIGHYPQLEAPGAVAAEISKHLQ
ncbi:MAG: alpha/beta fold hydrolase [Gammaproteobacteria bacterium]